MQKKIIFVVIGLSLVSLISTNVYAQSLYVDSHSGDLQRIENSKYFASVVNVLRNSDGEIVSVVTSTATRYLPKPVTDQFLDSIPIMKKGIVEGKNVEMRQVSVDYNYEKCLTEVFQVPGYSDQCNWYHRAFVTSLGINNEKGESFEIFRGLNHSYTVKPGDSVTSYWTIIRSD